MLKLQTYLIKLIVEFDIQQAYFYPVKRAKHTSWQVNINQNFEEILQQQGLAFFNLYLSIVHTNVAGGQITLMVN